VLSASNQFGREKKPTVNIGILLMYFGVFQNEIGKLLLLSKIQPHHLQHFQYVIDVARTL
jgi:hypothetical protein